MSTNNNMTIGNRGIGGGAGGGAGSGPEAMGGDNGYSNLRDDFTATIASTKTITLASLPSWLTVDATRIVAIATRPGAGEVDWEWIYLRGSGDLAISYAAGTITFDLAVLTVGYSAAVWIEGVGRYDLTDLTGLTRLATRDESFDATTGRAKVTVDSYDGVSGRDLVTVDSYDAVSGRDLVTVDSYDAVSGRDLVTVDSYDAVSGRDLVTVDSYDAGTGRDLVTVDSYDATLNRDMVRDDTYTTDTESGRVEEIDPIDTRGQADTIYDVTNAVDGTYYAYVSMDTYRKGFFQLELNGGSGTVTVTLEGTCQDEGVAAASRVYQDIGLATFAVANWVVDSVLGDNTEKLSGFTYLRFKLIFATGGADDGDATIYGVRLY